MSASAPPPLGSLRRIAPDAVKALSLSPVDETTMGQASAIMREVREGGEAKLVEIGTKFGDLKPGV